MSLLFNILSRFVIDLLLRSNCLLISWLQSPSAVILRAQEKEICHYFHLFPFYLLWNDETETGCHELSCCCCLIFRFNPAFSLPSFILIRSFFSFLLLSAITVVSYTYLGLLRISQRNINIHTLGSVFTTYILWWLKRFLIHF